MLCKAVFLRLRAPRKCKTKHNKTKTHTNKTMYQNRGPVPDICALETGPSALPAPSRSLGPLGSPAPTKSDPMGVGRPTRTALRNPDLNQGLSSTDRLVASDSQVPHLHSKYLQKAQNKKSDFPAI